MSCLFFLQKTFYGAHIQVLDKKVKVKQKGEYPTHLSFTSRYKSTTCPVYEYLQTHIFHCNTLQHLCLQACPFALAKFDLTILTTQQGKCIREAT